MSSDNSYLEIACAFETKARAAAAALNEELHVLAERTSKEGAKAPPMGLNDHIDPLTKILDVVKIGERDPQQIAQRAIAALDTAVLAKDV